MIDRLYLTTDKASRWHHSFAYRVLRSTYINVYKAFWVGQYNGGGKRAYILKWTDKSVNKTGTIDSFLFFDLHLNDMNLMCRHEEQYCAKVLGGTWVFFASQCLFSKIFGLKFWLFLLVSKLAVIQWPVNECILK